MYAEPGEEAEAERVYTMFENLFTYHAPTEDQTAAYGRIRKLAMDLALEIHDSVPLGPDRAAAIRKVREAVMTANAGIATKGGFCS